MSKHFSSFELDVWFADGKPSGDIAKHLTSCERCAAYVDELEALASEGASLRAPSPPARMRSLRRLVVPTATGLALAAGLALFIGSRSGKDDPEYVGTKGTPAVQVLVRTEGTTRIWDGRSPVRPGDAIALHVVCEGLAQVAVAAETRSGMARLSDGPCPSVPSTLPFTLVVDAEPGRERFSVVLTRSRVDDARLREVVQQRTRDRDVWVSSFELPKEVR